MTGHLSIAATTDHTRSEGPGSRFAVWLQGCSIRCQDCCNPEMLNKTGGIMVPVRNLAASVTASGLTDLSILGGEPLDQSTPLLEFIHLMRDKGVGIMLFTGHTMEEIVLDQKYHLLLQSVDLLKTGPFIRSRHSTAEPWIGSDNQEFHFLTGRYKNHPDFEKKNTQSISLSMDNGIAVLSGRPLDLFSGRGLGGQP